VSLPIKLNDKKSDASTTANQAE